MNRHQLLLNYELKPPPAATHKCTKIYICCGILVVSIRQLNNCKDGSL